MAEPWLDSLSEDWNSQPASSSSPGPLPSFGTPSASMRSRIPRYSYGRKSTSPAAGSQKTKPSGTTAGKRVLSERSVSDINLPVHSSPLQPTSTKPEESFRASTMSAASSAGSVVKHASLSHRPKSRSTAKSKTDTPEWKKLVLKGPKGPASQSDLLSPKPLGLESIFQRPVDIATEGKTNVKSHVSIFQGLDSIPSSPPPWPSTHRGAQLSLHPQIPSSQSGLDVVQEQDEEDQLSATVGSDGGSLCDTASPHAAVSEEPRKRINWIPQDEGQSDHPSSNDKSLIHDTPKRQVTSNDNAEHPINNQIEVAKQGSSSTTGDFSPVYISKFNTVDGRIDYTAVDVSNPETADFLRSYATAASGHVHEALENETPRVAENLPDLNYPSEIESQPQAGSQLAGISPFVTVERGGHSDEDSFRHRLLSSPYSSSIVPSDSVSQLYTKSPSNSARKEQRESNARLQEPSTSDSSLMADEQITASSSTAVNESRPSSNQNQLSPLENFGKPENNINVELSSRFERMSVSAALESQEATSKAALIPSEAGSGTTKSAETMIFRATSDEPPVLQRPSTPEPYVSEDSELDNQAKRPGLVTARQPTPKRQRTLGQVELRGATEHVSDAVKEQNRRMQAIIGKRKDARYDNDHASCDPEALAKREILHPRPLMSSHRTPSASKASEASSPLSDLDSILEHIDHFPLPNGVHGGDQIKALAQKVAIEAQRPQDDISRKPSVSTKDYLDEAMRIMDHLRSRRRARSDLSNFSELNEESYTADEYSDEDHDAGDAQPGSREGSISGWRSRDERPLDPRVLEQLQKYQETNNESFLVESVLQSLHLAEHDESFQERPDADVDEPFEIRVTGPQNDNQQSGDPINTHSSDPSTDSARTINTTVSQRSRTLPNIAPDTVSHLIGATKAGMRFDTERQTWVKAKKAERADDISSSTGTEDDPFQNIPDLSVNEMEEPQMNSQLRHTQGDGPLLQLPSHLNGPASQRETVQHLRATSGTSSDSSKPSTLHIHVEPPLQVPEDEEAVAEISLDDSTASEPQAHEDEHQVPGIPFRLSKSPASTVKSKRRDKSIMPSSPPYFDAEYADFDRQVEDLSYLDESEMGWKADEEGLQEQSLVRVSRKPVSTQVKGRRAIQGPWNSHGSSPLREHHEISLIRTRPDGRTMSLTVSVSTPLPMQKTRSREVIPSSTIRHTLWPSMSPLSEFTVHQDDRRHLESKNLCEPREQGMSIAPPPIVARELVERITTAEADQPYWEFMRTLDLADTKIANLHALDELCPRIEVFEVGRNALRHLEGAPPSIRQLNIPDNRLSSTTSWTHMINLQYLDVSNNLLENLNGLSHLVHLRELKANYNSIKDIEGVVDMDGLLSLSLEGNHLSSVDFSGVTLSRLQKLVLKKNNLTGIVGLDNLPSLEELDLSNNKLSALESPNHGPDNYAKCLKNLELADNDLTAIDIYLFPRLECLDVDGNQLEDIKGLEHHQNLRKLSVRRQKLSADASVDAILRASSEVTELLLAGNAIRDLSSIVDTVRYLNLQDLDLSMCGVDSLPRGFGHSFPNVRALNLSSNALKDLRPLGGLSKIHTLNLRATRVARLRRSASVLGSIGAALRDLDLRDTPLTMGFYPPERHDQEQEDIFDKRMDQDTRLRRRVYLMMLMAKCPKLYGIDDRTPQRWRVEAPDEDWDRLVDMGVVEIAN